MSSKDHPGLGIRNRGYPKCTVPSCWAGPRLLLAVLTNERPGLGTVIECVLQWEGREVSQQRAQCCNTTASLWLPRGADEMRKRGVSPSNPWLFRIVFQWKMTSKLWQLVTIAEVSCHRGIPLLTSPGWALSCRDVPQLRLVELVVGEGDPAGGALLNPPCLRPKIGRARCSAGKLSWYSIW